ncbi:AfsR/SARP family transcriptional regulator [Plantibacter sp. YIM 135347]|uniref:AfsR/SARP family transcriptional regulator n=1 Tax=Plantibacter sp. YIM 135347 TaxID=3423919 RepID=UPI003D328536
MSDRRASGVRVRVLGQVEAELDGTPLPLAKPRHREILALLVIAGGRPVSTSTLIDELWDAAGPGAVGAVRTFIGELRRILEPDRAPRTPPRVLVTVADGYALHLASDGTDLQRFEQAVREAAGLPTDGEADTGGDADSVERLLSGALDEWRGIPFAEFTDRPWADSERARLDSLRAGVVERLAEALLTLRRPADAVPLLERQTVQHPWREHSWRLLALALYRSERRTDALDAVRRARTHLVDELGLDPGRRLADLERDLLRNDPSLELPEGSESLLLRAASAHRRTGSRAQLESASALVTGLAVSGELDAAAEERMAIIEAAQALGDPELAARIVGGFDVPGVWTRSDDPVRSAAIVDAATRLLASLPPTASDRSRVRLLATVAMESRGTADRMPEAMAAERSAREIGDPQLLCFALAARHMQCFETTGLAAAREAIAAELVSIAIAAELPTFEIHGRLSRMQVLCALDDIAAAAVEADVVDALARRHERPLASVFTAWFRWTFLGGADTVGAEAPPAGEEMPGFTGGILALAAVASSLRNGQPPNGIDPAAPSSAELGPYEPWVRPVLLSRSGRTVEARAALDVVPDPPHDLLQEALWMLIGHAALETGHAPAARRAVEALIPASAERAAGSAVVDLGPIAPLLAELQLLAG